MVTSVSMILRVWVMYNRSRLILSALLMFFCLAIISTFIATVLYTDPRNVSGTLKLAQRTAFRTNLLSTPIPLVGLRTVVTIQILDVAFCMVQPIPFIWMKVAAILGIAHSAVVCIFVIVQFVRQSLQMYYATKQWQLSQYMRLLVKQGLLYFFACVPVSLFPSLLRCNLSPQYYQMS